MSGLRLAGVTKRFGSFTAIDGIDLDVHEGEFITLLGPSGCGKTTTLRAIAGFHTPDRGEIYIRDRLVNALPPNRRNTGMCFQSYALFPHMSVYDNVRFGLRMRRVAAAEQRRRVAEVLRMVELDQLAERKPSELSGGQQQRVALARAIVIEPDVLLFDEPLSNLDAKLRESVRVEIRTLQKRLGITAVYVTHDQAEALVISDRVVIMSHGRIEQIGEPHWVYDHPRTSFVAGFIGLANIRRGRVVAAASGGAARVRVDFGELEVADDTLREGEEVTLSFRPEDVLVAAGERSGADALRGPTDASGVRAPHNSFRGRVRQAIFMGNLTDLFIETGNATIRAQVAKGGTLREGDAVELRVPVDALRILEREPPS